MKEECGSIRHYFAACSQLQSSFTCSCSTHKIITYHPEFTFLCPTSLAYKQKRVDLVKENQTSRKKKYILLSFIHWNQRLSHIYPRTKSASQILLHSRPFKHWSTYSKILNFSRSVNLLQKETGCSVCPSLIASYCALAIEKFFFFITHKFIIIQ